MNNAHSIFEEGDCVLVPQKVNGLEQRWYVGTILHLKGLWAICETVNGRMNLHITRLYKITKKDSFLINLKEGLTEKELQAYQQKGEIQ